MQVHLVQSIGVVHVRIEHRMGSAVAPNALNHKKHLSLIPLHGGSDFPPGTTLASTTTEKSRG